MLYSRDEALKNFLNSEPFTGDVQESIISARREDAEYEAKHGGERERIL